MTRLVFGISLEEREDMERRQDYACAICGRKEVGRSLAVDHCHKTGRVRGLLCFHCNTGIGLLGETSESLKLAMDYLSRNKKDNLSSKEEACLTQVP